VSDVRAEKVSSERSAEWVFNILYSRGTYPTYTYQELINEIARRYDVRLTRPQLGAAFRFIRLNYRGGYGQLICDQRSEYSTYRLEANPHGVNAYVQRIAKQWGSTLLNVAVAMNDVDGTDDDIVQALEALRKVLTHTSQLQEATVATDFRQRVLRRLNWSIDEPRSAAAESRT
jgi:hypothetical protein